MAVDTLSKAIKVLKKKKNLDEFLGTISREEAFDLYHEAADLLDMISDGTLRASDRDASERYHVIALSAKARSQGHIADAVAGRGR